jgi:imidazolonepropionase-like amidohydrolase
MMTPGLQRLLALAAALALFSAACSDDPSNNNGEPDPDAISGDVELDGDQPDAGPDADDDGGGNPPANIVTCDNTLEAPSGGASCTTTSGSSNLVMLQGDVLAGDTVYENGQVLVDRSSDNATIACVGCDCGTQAGADSATVVSCPSSVISPGLINAHEHLGWGARSPKPHGDERYDHRSDWRRGKRGHDSISSGGGDYSSEAVLFGELRHLMGGATSMAGSGGSGGFVRNLDQSSNSGGLNVSVEYETFPLGDINGQLMADGCGYPDIPSDSVISAGGVYLPHISEGIDSEAQNEFACLSSASGGGSDIIADNTSVIHGIGLTAADIAEFSASGADLVWSPRTNIDLYGNTADVVTYNNYGANIALGTDWVLSGSMNMLRELACVDYLNQNHYDNHFSDFQIWKMVTANGAQAMGVGDQLGTLANGYIADITIIDASQSSNYRAVLNARAADVQLVMRGGDAIVGEANIVEVLVPADDAGQCETITVCDGERTICAERDTGFDWATIIGAASGNYEPFFCDSPTDEPSCVPARPDEYSGMSSADDQDGDGVADADDTCPAIFNPMRPVDDGTQADFDGDGIGDSCDVCPLAEGETCDPFDPTDRDDDGVTNDEDNCPAMANTDQADADSDGLGDLCDPCSDFANPGNTGCPGTIYDIWSGTTAVGTKVLIQDAIVTAAGEDGSFIQYPSDAADFSGVEQSGIYVYMPDVAPAPTRGDRIDVSATVSEFGGVAQLQGPDAVTINSSANTLPTPVDVAAADVATGGADADAYVGVLIRIGSVTVTDANPDAPDDFNEFSVSGGLRVDDLLYLIEPDPVVGDSFNGIVGILNSSFSNSKLEPRDENDIILGPPSLVDLMPSTSYLEVGASSQIPTPGLRISLNRAPAQDETVAVSYSNASVSGPATVVVPANQQSVDLELNGDGAAGDSTDVTASLRGDMFTSTVTLYDDASARTVASLTPASQTVQLNQAVPLTVTLNLPAPTGGQAVTVGATGEATAPGTVTVPAGALSVDFAATASAAAGQATVTATLGGSSESADVTVTDAPSTPCLIIGEYIEGSSFNKGIELFNCGTTDLELSNFGVCHVNGSGGECDSELTLPSGSLAAGGVHTLCNPQASFSCDTSHGSVINHNGNDRYIIYKDEDASGAYEAANDTATDAFGETATDPGDIWADQTYRRCDFTPYYGASAFTVTDIYQEFAQDEFSDFGVAPTAGCP